MANKLAGQRAKFTKAQVNWQKTEDDDERQNAARHMAEVLQQAPENGFQVDEVTQGAEVPQEVLDIIERGYPPPKRSLDDPDQLVRALQQTVDLLIRRRLVQGIKLYTLTVTVVREIVSRWAGATETS